LKLNNIKDISITGMGMMTSVGHNAPQASTSIRAGIARFGETPQFEPTVQDPDLYFPEPLIAAPVIGITDGLVGIERLLALSVPALREALEGAKIGAAELPETMLLVAGGQRPGSGKGSRVDTVFVPRLASRIKGGPFKGIEYLPQGSAGFLLALKKGMDLLRQGACLYCVVGSVDSLLDLEALTWLDSKGRLKSESNVDGFIPGEAAAFIVIELQKNTLQRGVGQYALCGEAVIAEEKNTRWSETSCTGEGLSQCLKTVLAGLKEKGRNPDAVLCDLNGEGYRSKEWGYALIKAFRGNLSVPSILIHPSDCIGDVGAAIGGILVGLSCHSMKMDHVDWNDTVIWCSSDDGERAALSVSR
jgi:3-oxoacyl-[acyl-carrier-protein] synthase I